MSVNFFPGYYNLSVYYTTDGSEPSAQSQLYNEYQGVPITETTTIKAKLFENGQAIDDTVYTATYTKRTANPGVLLPAGTVTYPTEVTFTCENAQCGVFNYARVARCAGECGRHARGGDPAGKNL